MILDEKRAFKRVKKKISMWYSARKDRRVISGTAFTENISLGGLYFESLNELTVGEEIDIGLEFSGKTEKDLSCKARVVRADPFSGRIVEMFGIAAEFINLSENIKKEIKKII